VRVYLGDKIVLDALDFPPKGKGMIRNDSLIIEKRIPLEIPAGRTRLTLTTMNSTGLWIYCLRFTDHQGIPLPDLKFRREWTMNLPPWSNPPPNCPIRRALQRRAPGVGRIYCTTSPHCARAVSP
jgi:hypothetical protein